MNKTVSSAFRTHLLPSIVSAVALLQVMDAFHLGHSSSFLAVLPAPTQFPCMSCLLMNNKSPWYGFKYIHLLSSSSASQKCGHSFSGSSASGNPTRLQSRCEPRLRSTWSYDWGKVHVQAHRTVDKAQFLKGYWTGGLCPLLVVGQRPPHPHFFDIFLASSRCTSQESSGENLLASWKLQSCII